MAELIGALVEAVAGLVAAIAGAMPAILEALAYVAAGAVTIIACALSRRFRERKEHPKSKYLDLGISTACLGVLVALAGWILWALLKPTPPHGSPLRDEAQNSGELRMIITKRSGENSNELKIAVPREAIAKLLQKKARRQSEQDVHQEAGSAGAVGLGANTIQPHGPANGGQPSGSDTNSTPLTAGSRR